MEVCKRLSPPVIGRPAVARIFVARDTTRWLSDLADASIAAAIDHLLLSPALAPALKAAGVDKFMRGREKPSDHTPTWVELDLSKLS